MNVPQEEDPVDDEDPGVATTLEVCVASTVAFEIDAAFFTASEFTFSAIFEVGFGISAAAFAAFDAVVAEICSDTLSETLRETPRTTDVTNRDAKTENIVE